MHNNLEYLILTTFRTRDTSMLISAAVFQRRPDDARIARYLQQPSSFLAHLTLVGGFDQRSQQ